MINRLRSYFPEGSNYLITGAPQCVVNDANMDLMIQGAQFDIIWVQFYNTDGCAARDWVELNPNYAKTGVETTVPKLYPHGGFSYDAWLKRLQAPGSKSKNAKLSIGVLGALDPTSSIDYYLSADQLKPLIDEYYCHDNFGGFMIWDAVSAGNNKDQNGVTYLAQIKNLLVAREAKGCAKPTSTVSSTISSTTISSTTTKSSSSTKAPVTTSTDAPITTGPLTTGPSTAVPTSTGHWGNNTISDSPTLTSTILRTTVYTVTSCAPTVTNCPLGHLTTATLTDYTTWCPGNPTITAAPTTTAAAIPTKSGKPSTVYTTIIHTITACPPSVTNCPANEKTTSVVTETKALYTTICDVETTLQTAPAATGGIKDPPDYSIRWWCWTRRWKRLCGGCCGCVGAADVNACVCGMGSENIRFYDLKRNIVMIFIYLEIMAC
jgi:chitinase